MLGTMGCVLFSKVKRKDLDATFFQASGGQNSAREMKAHRAGKEGFPKYVEKYTLMWICLLKEHGGPLTSTRFFLRRVHSPDVNILIDELEILGRCSGFGFTLFFYKEKDVFVLNRSFGTFRQSLEQSVFFKKFQFPDIT